MRADVVGRAMRLIADGAVDREGVPGLAARLGYSTRQLERHLLAEVGAGPLALARAQRAQTARVLIETTGLPMADVAFAAGFASIRQFNDTVRAVFAAHADRAAGPAPGRAAPVRAAGRRSTPPPALPLTLSAPTTSSATWPPPPCPGCEEVRDGAYRRTLRLPHGPGIVSLDPDPGLHRAASSPWTTCATWPPPSPAAAGCSTSTPTPRPSMEVLAEDAALRRVVAKVAGPARPRHRGRAPRWPCARCSASRCPRRRPGPTPPAWSPPTARRSTTRWGPDPPVPLRRPSWRDLDPATLGLPRGPPGGLRRPGRRAGLGGRRHRGRAPTGTGPPRAGRRRRASGPGPSR